MAQDTTKEFAARLERAVDGHPLAPPTPYGRQAWVLEKLKKEANLAVSPNTMSKWFNGDARPRPDNIRKIAQVLRVDEVWLALGRMPSDQPSAPAGAERANGAMMIAAGLIEISGGRVSFAPAEAKPVDLRVNIDNEQFDVVLATHTNDGENVNFLVNEPVGSARVVAVMPEKGAENRDSFGIYLYDLTDLPRQTFGGFSIISATREGTKHFRIEGHKDLLRPRANALGGAS